MDSNSDTGSGWAWFDANAASGAQMQVKELFETAFATAAGRLVLAHLRRTFLERRLAPDASDEVLRHLEGARYAIAYIERLARGEGIPKTEHIDAGDIE